MGYLEDGTMVVVRQAVNDIGHEVGSHGYQCVPDFGRPNDIYQEDTGIFG